MLYTGDDKGIDIDVPVMLCQPKEVAVLRILVYSVDDELVSNICTAIIVKGIQILEHDCA